MEYSSHSLPTKTYRSNVVAGKTPYDDVFKARPNFKVPTLSPRDEDYEEIFQVFHSSRGGSSIPLLDLPAVGCEASDVLPVGRSSGFEYSDVFGSFNGSDFAICYDEMFIQPKAVDDSTDESWTPAQSESLSDESDPWSEKNQNLSGGDIHHSHHHTKQFNISYNKANPEGKECIINGMTHVTQLDAIPGYSFIMNETSRLQYAEDESAHLWIEEHIDLGAVVAEGNRLKTTVSQPSVNGFGLQCYETEPNHLAGYANSNSPGKASILESDVILNTRTSHLPPPSYSKLNSKIKACNSHVLERREADYSPPHFDVEIDASSTAAASSASMEDAVEKAQAECDGAKDMMERKEDVDNCTKSHWENDICRKGENNISSKGGRFPHRCEREGSKMKAYAEEQSKQVRHTIHVDSGAIDGKDNIHAEQGKEHTQSHVRYKSDGTVAWREATCYYELVEESNGGEANTSGTGAFVEQQDYHMRTKAATKDHECQEIGKNGKVLKGGCEQVAWTAGKVGQGSVRQEEHTENSDRAQKVGEWLGKGNKTRLTSLPGETDNKTREVDKFVSNDIQTEDHLEKYEVITKQKAKEVSERTEYVIEKKESLKREGIGMQRKASLDANEYEIDLISGVQQVEDGGKLRETVGKSSVEKLNKEICLVCARQVGENKHEKTCEMGQDKKKRVEAAESEGNTKRSNEVFVQEVNKNILRVDLKQQKSKKEQNCDGKAEKKEKSSKMTTVQWQNAERKKGACEERPNDDFEPDENEKRLIEAWEKKEKWKRLRAAREMEKSEKKVKLLFKEDSIENSSSKVDVLTDFKNNIDKERNGEGFNGQNSVHEQLKKVVSNTELNMDQANGTIREDQKKSNEVNVSSKAHTLAARVTVCDNINGNWETHEPSVFEEYKSLRMKHKTHEREVEVNNDPLKDETTSSDKNQSTFQHEGTNDENKAESLCRIGIVGRSDDNDIDLKGIHFNKGKENSEIASDTENAHLLIPKQTEERFGFYQEEKKDIITASQVVQESVNNESNLEDVLPAHRFRSQTPELQETKFRKKIIIEEKEEEERLKRERDLENDNLRKIEQENEREREREKDRMAVDTATREACERAFAEARERAALERETAEVRQRALAEARERLLKASAEARERLFADMAVDARLKADRNAVERAMAEARQRAFEKAKAEKASYETSEVRRPVTDNYSSYSRNGGIRTSSNDLQNLQHQSMGPQCDLIYSHSSVVSGLESESAQRCKARLERHQRTAERAAKALAEKNKRDLLAHKEQTERNRLAEFLDADVKRWSSGKEGNLRALLSTLQYILGTDSGWQPIPLTEVITSAAVKKAYRKATLCVHPDKLQQRGASIHQKYICEKVFDLLKEAWNKFNSEER